MGSVSTRGENVDDRDVGGDGPVRRSRTALLVAGAAALVLAILTAGTAAPALAVGTPTSARSTATPAPEQDLVTPPSSGRPGAPLPPESGRPPVRPTIADPGDVTTSTVRLHGTGTPGHAVRVSGPAATGSTGCTASVATDGTWACFADVRSGPQQVFTVEDPAVGSARTPASDVIVPPTVTTTRPTPGPVSGTGHAGSTVTLTVSGSQTDRTTTVGSDGRWTVTLAGTRSDGRVSVSATQTASTADGYRSDLRSAASTPVTVTLDSTPPKAPRITSPTSGDRVRAQPVSLAGVGERGAVVTVYVDRSPVCRVDVSDSGTWACSTGDSTLRPGTRTISAMQQDAAGNFSPSSAVVRVSVTQASTAPTSGSHSPGAGPTGAATTTGSHPSGTGSTPGAGPSTPSASASGATGGSTGGTGPGTPTGGAGSGSGVGGHGTPASGSGGVDWSGPAGDWTASTTYDSTVPSIQASFSWRTVFVATGVAAGFLVLVAGPLALVAAAARGRLRSPFSGLLGRNRPLQERRAGDLLPTWASITVATAFVGMCTVLGVGVSLEARYVRLAIAVLVGAAVLTAATVLASRWAAGADRRLIGFRLSPWLVVAALAACGLTRALDLSPALVVGVVLVPVGRPAPDTGALRLGSDTAAGSRSATWRSVALLVVAAVGWVLHSLTPGSGFWVSIVSEFATTLCVGGIGAVVLTLLPFVGSAGSALLARSRARYAAIAAVAVALAAAVYSGSSGTHVSPVALAAVAAGCLAGAAAAWVWRREPEPAPRA